MKTSSFLVGLGTVAALLAAPVFFSGCKTTSAASGEASHGCGCKNKHLKDSHASVENYGDNADKVSDSHCGNEKCEGTCDHQRK